MYNNNIIVATKWSAITEIIAKLVSPITNLILARILVPEAFGIVATITMVISFADMFTDAGFQKYIVQHEFKQKEDKNLYTNVAFWTNFTMSLLICFFIIVFSEKIASVVGNPGLGNVISISSIQIILTSFTSIQMAIYRRAFDFKTLFMVRIIGITVPFLITIPLALIGANYWSLIIGNIFGAFLNAIILTVKSEWKPKLIYNFKVLKEMLSFSIWSLIEAISIWLTSWIDTFIIGSVLSTYYVGIYKTSVTTVNGIFALITSATTPVLFSALSRCQNDTDKFNKLFFNMQKIVAYLVMPMSMGMFIYKETVVKIFLGNNWGEASNVIGIWALMSGIVIVLGHYSSEVYRAKGKPKLSFLAQLLHLIVLVISLLIASRYDFVTLVNVRAIVRLQIVLVHMVLMQIIVGISVNDMIKNVSIPFLSAIAMGFIGFIIRDAYQSLLWQFISIGICSICYIIFLLCFKDSRSDIKLILKRISYKSS